MLNFEKILKNQEIRLRGMSRMNIILLSDGYLYNFFCVLFDARLPLSTQTQEWSVTQKMFGMIIKRGRTVQIFENENPFLSKRANYRRFTKCQIHPTFNIQYLIFERIHFSLTHSRYHIGSICVHTLYNNVITSE